MKSALYIVRKAFIFALGPAFAAVASLLALPAMTRNFGATAWAAIAIGLSVGTAASVLVELGWGLDGPARISRASIRTRRALYALSLTTKLVAVPLVAAASAITAAWLAADFKIESALTAVYAASLGLTSAWYFVGEGRPGALIITDSVPKLVFALLAAIVLSSGAPLIAYPALLLVGQVIATALASSFILHNKFSLLFAFSWVRVFRAIASQFTALRGRVASALYLALPVAILGVVAPSAVAVFAASDRLQRMALTFLQIAPNAMLSWVASEKDFGLRLKKTKITIFINSFFGALAGALWVMMMSVVAEYVFASKIIIPAEIIWLSAYVIWVTCTSRAVGGVGLITFRAVKNVSDSAGVGAATGLVLVATLGSQWGATGAFLALAITETIVLAWQVRSLIKIAR